MRHVINAQFEINILGLLKVLKLAEKLFASMYVIPWLVIQMANPGSIGLNHVLSGRKIRSQNLKLGLLLLMVTVILLISLCGVIWGHSQERLHNSSSYNPLGCDLVPFVDIQSHESTREASTLSVPVLSVERQTTSVETVHTPGVQHKSHNSPRYPPTVRQLQQEKPQI